MTAAATPPTATPPPDLRGADAGSRFNRRTGELREVGPYPRFFSGEPASAVVERWQWTYPIIFSPVDPNVLYASSQHVWKTTNDGQSWTKISPDLTRADPATLGDSGGPITRDMNGPEVFATAYGFSLDSQSETTDETSLISRSAWLKQAKMPGRASVMIWCSHSGKDAQYAFSQASVASVMAVSRSPRGAPWSSIRSISSALSRKSVEVSLSNSAVRRASSAAAPASGRARRGRTRH